MKKRFHLGLILIVLTLQVFAAKSVTNPRPFTIPAIHQWTGSTGSLTLTPASRILYADVRLRTAAESLARDWQTAGLSLTVCEGKKAAEGDVLFVYKPQKKLGEEGYTIDIAKGIRIEATEQEPCMPLRRCCSWAPRSPRDVSPTGLTIRCVA